MVSKQPVAHRSSVRDNQFKIRNPKNVEFLGFSFIDNLTGGKLTEIKDIFTNKMSEIGTRLGAIIALIHYR